ncbi:Uncharacterised protein [Mycobacteroides abscessus subsp. abscessus]|nr:Uncharacterised protein [Mycobacteroides abscessus subsp. abscessus]
MPPLTKIVCAVVHPDSGRTSSLATGRMSSPRPICPLILIDSSQAMFSSDSAG